jgi:hypothetical protein
MLPNGLAIKYRQVNCIMLNLSNFAGNFSMSWSGDGWDHMVVPGIQATMRETSASPDERLANYIISLCSINRTD